MPVLADNKGLKDSFMWRISLPLLLVVAAAGVAGLKDVQVNVPEAAATGDTVQLQCRYDLETDSLYSVKWYKGRQEFFRYIPKELPHTRVFPLANIDVDVSRSGPAMVVLRAVTPSLSGRYRCEVSADAPSFHTAMKTSYMHVVELPDAAPMIFAEKNRVAVGETLKARCTAPPAHPPANLTWILNDKIVVKGTPIILDDEETPKKAHAQPISNDIDTAYHNNATKPKPTDKQGIEAKTEEIVKKRSGSLLVLPITQDVFHQQGQLRITCKASVFSLYQAAANLTLDEDKPQIAPILGNTQNIQSNAASCYRPSAILAMLLLLLHHLAS